MKFQAVKTLMLGTIFVIVVMSIYFALIPESYYQDHHHRLRNRTYALHKAGHQMSSEQSESSAGVTENRGDGVSLETQTSLQIARDISRREGVVMFTMVNDAFFPFAASWCCNTELMRNVHQRTLFLTTDAKSGERLKKTWSNITVLSLDGGKYAGAQEYSKAGYIRMMVERTQYILRLLEAGVRLLLFEVDCLWLKDPVPMLLQRKAEGDIFATKVTGQDVTAGGFLLLNPTTPTVQLWRELTRMMEDLDKQLSHRGDSYLVSEGLNDQQFFTSLINKRYAGIKVVYLQPDLFPDGKWYSLSKEQRSAKPRPFIINNNWVIGDVAKIKRAKFFGHWFWIEEGGGSCNSTAVHKLLG